MRGPEPKELALRALRRVLGLSVALFAFYLVVPLWWERIQPLTAEAVVAILGVVFAGVWLGIGFSTVWPMPAETGLPRAVRTVLLAIPALGIGLAIQVTLVVSLNVRAYYVIFALAAWLGSGFIEAEAAEADAGEETAVSEG